MYRGRQGVAAIFVFLILVVIVAAVVLLPRACSANESPGSEEAETMPVSGASLSDQPDAYWYQRSIGLKDAWDLMRKHRHSPVKVALLDTAVDVSDKDLQKNVLPEYAVDATKNFRIYAYSSKKVVHGTNMAGAIGASYGNKGQIAGAAAGYRNDIVRIMPIKVAADGQINARSASNEVVAKAVRYAVDHGAKVINMSFGHGAPDGDVREDDRVLQKAVDYAASHDVTVVAAAGNFASTAPWYPSDLKHVISVIGTKHYRDAWSNPRALFSNYGEKFISAPGRRVTPIRPAYYGLKENGTSYAAATVTSVAAMLYSVDPSMTPDLVRYILQATATDLYEKGWDDQTGYGNVHAGRAVRMALGLPVKTKFTFPRLSTKAKLSPRKRSVRITWSEPTSGRVNYYQIQKRRKNGNWKNLKCVPGYTWKYKDRKVKPGRTYLYRVRAVGTLHYSKSVGKYSRPSRVHYTRRAGNIQKG